LHSARAPLLVSACLLGVACNHEGRASTRPAVVSLGRDRRLIPVCPESAGGLPTPRPAAEIGPDGRVRTGAGDDVTDAYVRGAAQAVRLARAAGAAGAVLKARSPSCGCHEVYDGSFTRTRVQGEGVTAHALRTAGVPVWSEEDVEAGALDAGPGAGSGGADGPTDDPTDGGAAGDRDAGGER
jgi:uncharacterized protein YbbK (DUF523 family)